MRFETFQKTAVAIWVVWFVVWVGIVAGSIYAAIHFIQKYW